MIIRTLLVIFSCFFLLGNGTESKPNGRIRVHLIKILDTNNEVNVIRLAANSVASRMEQEARIVAEKLNADYVQHDLSGAFFNVKAIKATLNNLRFGKEDIVIIAHLGHGYRLATDGLAIQRQGEQYLPRLYFQNKEVMELSEIFEIVAEKSPNKIIAVVNACNSQTINDDRRLGTATLGKDDNSDFSFYAPNYATREIKRVQALFQNRDANKVELVALLSCSPNQETLVDENGGLFFTCLNQSIDRFLQKNYSDKCTWDDVMQHTIATMQKIDRYKAEEQLPRCVTLHYLPAAGIEVQRFTNSNGIRSIGKQATKLPKLLFDTFKNKED